MSVSEVRKCDCNASQLNAHQRVHTMRSIHTNYASDETSETERNAYNVAFCELGLEWHWDANTYNELRTIAQQKEPVRTYLESQRPHLLRAYDVDFLVNAIDSKRKQFNQMMAI